MILRYVKLHNIRSYSDEKIEFPKGSLLLSGDIGTGKSTILLAIEFVLFGIRGKQLSGSTLLRHGENSGLVELGFSIGKKEIIIKRTLKRTKDSIKQESGYLVTNGVMKEGTPTELKTWVIELLGYPSELVSKSSDLVFRYTVYTPQEEMKQILFDDRETRLDTLRRIFQIEKYKAIQKNAEFYLRLLKEKTREQEGRIADLEEKRKELDERKLEREKHQLLLDSLTPLLEQTQKRKELKENEIQESEEKQRELNRIKEKIKVNNAAFQEKARTIREIPEKIIKLDNQIAELRKRIENLRVEKPSNKTEEELEEEIEKESDRVMRIKQQRFELNERINQTESREKEFLKELEKKDELEKQIRIQAEEISSLEKEIKRKDELMEKIVETRKKLEQTTEQLQRLTANTESSEKILKEIIDKNKCPTCEQTIPQFHKVQLEQKQSGMIRYSKEKISRLQQDQEELGNELEKSEKSREALFDLEKKLEKDKVQQASNEKALKDLKEKEEQYLKLKKEKQRYEQELEKNKEHDIEELKRQIDARKVLLKRVVEYLAKSKEMESCITLKHEREKEKSSLTESERRIKEELERLRKEIKESETKLESMKGVEEEYANRKDELKEIMENEKKQVVKIAEIKTTLKAVQEVINRLAEDIRAKEEMKKRILTLSQFQHWVDELFINLVAAIERQVMLKLYHEFNELFVRWFNILIEDESLNVRLDEEFTPVIEQNGFETTVANLSGGERTSCALAYRLALNKVINDLIAEIRTRDLIILDEPTDGFSTEQLDKVRDVLEQLDNEQIIIVSHESKIESYVDNIKRITKVEGVSSVS